MPAAQKIRRLSNKSKVSATYLYEVQSGGSYVVRFCVAQPGRITGTGYGESTSAPFTLCPPDGHFRPGLWRESGGRERSLPMALRSDNQYESVGNAWLKKEEIAMPARITAFIYGLIC